MPEERQNLNARQRPLWALSLQLLQPTETHCGAAAVGMLTAAGARRLQLQATAKRPVRTQADGLVSMAVGGNCTAGGASAQHTTTNEATRHSKKGIGVTAGGNGSRTAARQHGCCTATALQPGRNRPPGGAIVMQLVPREQLQLHNACPHGRVATVGNARRMNAAA